MKPQRTTALYWTLTLIFAAFMLLAGIAEFLQNQEGQEIMRHLGYPLHVMRVIGLGKILGALAMLQTRFRTLKEWAYAGFTFNLLGACAARYAAHDGIVLIVSPLLFLAFMAFTYALWKKVARPAAERSPTLPLAVAA
ncbi:DoxX family protein [Hymenobacter busanensis]|nr:DoxX family protein [Hymenobacter busanensis]QHJ07854.1 DoxX family protein [Hymenobacter busanensis]